MDTQSDQIIKSSLTNRWKIAFLVESVLFLVVVVVGFTMLHSRQQLIKKFQTEIVKLDTSNDIPTPELNFVLPNVTSWSTFSDPAFSFTFQYPENWYVTNLSDQRVAVSNKAEFCENCESNTEQDIYAVIFDEATELSDPLVIRPDNQRDLLASAIVSQRWVDAVMSVSDCGTQKTVSGNCPPIIPGISLNAPIADVSEFFDQPTQLSVATGNWSGYTGFDSYFYYTAIHKNRYEYHLAAIAPAESWLEGEPTSKTESERLPQHPVVRILKSFKSAK